MRAQIIAAPLFLVPVIAFFLIRIEPGEQAVTPAAQKVAPALVAMTSAGDFACMSGRVFVGISVKARERVIPFR